ncbi:type II CAAX prenyl endopeptidase Rce1 family protein [Ruoffia sp. FAM 26254]
MAEENSIRKEIRSFIFYTFLISWVSWAIIILGNKYFDFLWYGEPLFWIPMLTGGLGPAISVYIISEKSNKDYTLKSFLAFLSSGNISRLGWLVFVLYIVGRFLMTWFGFGIEDPISIIYMFINLPLFIIGGGFEEIGWRGYLQPKLEKKYNYITAVLMVGIIWALWHLPLWFIKGTVQSALPFFLYLFLVIILSFSFTTIYKYTRNIFLCILSHAWFNGCIGLGVYIGVNGYLQLNLNWRVFLVFLLEFIFSFILSIKLVHKSKRDV